LELVAAIKEIEKGILFNLGQGHLYPKMSHEQTSSNHQPSQVKWQTRLIPLREGGKHIFVIVAAHKQVYALTRKPLNMEPER